MQLAVPGGREVALRLYGMLNVLVAAFGRCSLLGNLLSAGNNARRRGVVDCATALVSLDTGFSDLDGLQQRLFDAVPFACGGGRAPPTSSFDRCGLEGAEVFLLT